MFAVDMQGGQLVIYGCICGTAPSWPSSTWILQGIQVWRIPLRTSSYLQITFVEKQVAAALPQGRCEWMDVLCCTWHYLRHLSSS